MTIDFEHAAPTGTAWQNPWLKDWDTDTLDQVQLHIMQQVQDLDSFAVPFNLVGVGEEAICANHDKHLCMHGFSPFRHQTIGSEQQRQSGHLLCPPPVSSCQQSSVVRPSVKL